MLKLQLLVLVPVFWAVAQGSVFERCQWARLLKSRGMDQYQKISLADWVCLTRWESSFNTRAVNHNRDNSTDYGIFQINSKWWCRDSGPSRANGCNINCSALLADDPTVAINCAKTVARQQGAKAWVAWKVHCQGKDVSQYIAGCGLDLSDSASNFL
ncbi:lysozyme C-like [Boleophthalmus pectinirostris]|uniref:lysozyme C-like n=1 Tax=Boleophthalmus pectinirostris TaxID=150288 RepID=UPI00242A89D6|nr:lysozyme C-like [Boleophthalmus pectinirostris]